MGVRVIIDLRDLNRRARVATKGTAERVARRADILINARSWTWPGTTLRANGSVAGTKRNIVDTGTLRDSRHDPVLNDTRGGHSARLTWGAPHAAAVFLGAVFRKRRYVMPARNAPLAAVKRGTLQDFARAWQEAE